MIGDGGAYVPPTYSSRFFHRSIRQETHPPASPWSLTAHTRHVASDTSFPFARGQTHAGKHSPPTARCILLQPASRPAVLNPPPRSQQAPTSPPKTLHSRHHVRIYGRQVELPNHLVIMSPSRRAGRWSTSWRGNTLFTTVHTHGTEFFRGSTKQKRYDSSSSVYFSARPAATSVVHATCCMFCFPRGGYNSVGESLGSCTQGSTGGVV